MDKIVKNKYFSIEADEDVWKISFHRNDFEFFWDSGSTLDAFNLIRTIEDVGSGGLDSKHIFVGYGIFRIANIYQKGVLHTQLQVNPPGFNCWIDIDWNHLQKLRSALIQFMQAFPVKKPQQKNPYWHIKDPNKDHVLYCALTHIFESKSATATMLQRRMARSFPFCLEIIDYLEHIGWIGPQRGCRARSIEFEFEQYGSSYFLNSNQGKKKT